MPGLLEEKRPVAKIVESLSPPPTFKKLFRIFSLPAMMSASICSPYSLSNE